MGANPSFSFEKEFDLSLLGRHFINQNFWPCSGANLYEMFKFFKSGNWSVRYPHLTNTWQPYNSKLTYGSTILWAGKSIPGCGCVFQNLALSQRIQLTIDKSKDPDLSNAGVTFIIQRCSWVFQNCTLVQRNINQRRAKILYFVSPWVTFSSVSSSKENQTE